jgi:cytochrome bd-type quinol oxidase subunit 1
MAAQLHLFFAAFILGVPMFSVLIEFIGIWKKDDHYDKLAREFAKLLVTATGITALFGAILLLLLVSLYPSFFSYMSSIFSPAFAFYGLLFFAESLTMYVYWYSWDRMKTGRRKSIHASLGIVLNVWGTVILLVTDSWATFMMSPAGVDATGALSAEAGGFWSAMQPALWLPLNWHRLLGNAALGGAIVGAYGAFKFLGAKTREERAHYDWMGNVGNFVAILALIPLPFLGYVLAREVYQFSQPMGITMMGGFLSWLWIIQAVLIGTIFLAANYYLWVGMERIPGGERYRAYIGPLLLVLTASFLV